MCTPESNREWRFAFSAMTCAVLFSATLVQAQPLSELRPLALYPASTDALDIAPLDAGLYAQELTQQLTSTGLRLEQQSRYQEALSTFERAAESSRIHQGLYSPEQIALTEHSIHNLVALGRFDEAEDKYNALLNIYRKLYGADASQTAHALLGFGQWQLERLQHDLAQPDFGGQQRVHEPVGSSGGYEVSSVRFDGLYAAQAHFVDAIRILIANEDWSDPALYALEKGLIRTYYLDAQRAGVIESENPAIAGESSHSRLRARANRKALPEQYLKGKQAYLRMIDYLKKNPDTDIAGIKDVMLGFADWHRLFGNNAEADEQYRQLEQIMVLAGVAPESAAAMLHPAS